MMLKAFSLLDTKTGMYNVPFFLAHEGQAIRSVIDLGQDMNTTVGRHPADFQLCYIGYFDDQTGIMTPEMPVVYGTVASLLPQTPERGQLFADPDQVIIERMNGAQKGA